MNIFDNINALLLFIAFFVPGFISMKTYEVLVPNDFRKTTSWIFEAVAYSALNFALLSPILFVLAHYHVTSLLPWLIIIILALIVIPPSLAWAYITVLTKRETKKYTIGLYKRPWDVIFSKNEVLWLIVTLNNGDKIAGVFGNHSSASFHPHDEQIYLEKAFNVSKDGRPTIVPDSRGVIIMGKDILTIELFNEGQVNDD